MAPDIEFLKYIQERMDRIEDKMDFNHKYLARKIEDLYKFRWQIIGGATTLSVLVGVAMKMVWG